MLDLLDPPRLSRMAKRKARRAGRPPLGQEAKSRDDDRHKTPRESFHLPGELREALIAYRDSTYPRVDKSAIIRSAIEEFLLKRGYWTGTKPRQP